jgi:hypothetical protein
MDDYVLLLVSLCAGIAGLVLLFFLSPPGNEQYVLSGHVVSKRGNTLVVQTNVTLIARDASASEWTVFWAEDRFVSAAD